MLVILTLLMRLAFGNSASFYFVTHPSYSTSTLNSRIIAAHNISGNNDSVMQHCRRHCALNPFCQAFHVALIKDLTDVGTFTCNLFATNACDWTNTSLRNTSFTPINQLWDKLDSKLKRKACAEYCAVEYKGDCFACRGFTNLRGLDCDIAPKLCLDYNNTGWSEKLVWPWGFSAPHFKVNCYYQYTSFLAKKPGSDGTAALHMTGGLGWTTYSGLTTLNSYNDAIQRINWDVISVLTSNSVNKILRVYMQGSSEFYTGFELSPLGELSLNASLNSSSGFVTPLSKVPFVHEPVGMNENCGAFWQFQASIPICSGQETNLLNFQEPVLSTKTYSNTTIIFFMFV